MNLKELLTALLLLLIAAQNIIGQTMEQPGTEANVMEQSVAADQAADRPARDRRHWGVTLYGGPAMQIAMDEYERKWLRGKQQWMIGGELHYKALPSDQDAFAEDYNYPSLSVGLKYSFNHGVTMHRTEDEAWGMADMVDYDSRLGNILTLYGAFSRPLWRRGRWQLDYLMRLGVGYNSMQYHPADNIDNELIGSHFTIYFGAGVQAAYRLTDDVALTAGLLYGHHSNGALDRPNKGENHIGPTVGLRYAPSDKSDRCIGGNRSSGDTDADFRPAAVAVNRPFSSYWYAMLRAGVGGKSLLEDWQLTQFHTPPGAPDYRTNHFRRYAAYSVQADVMCRYARRWASGIGLDACYGTYDHRVRQLEAAYDQPAKVSPWSVGIAGKHEVYYHNLSLDMALGIYLYRHMGTHAKEIEKPYYERVGLFYSIPKWGGLRIGCSVKAHLTKADLTELTVAFPIRLRSGE